MIVGESRLINNKMLVSVRGKYLDRSSESPLNNGYFVKVKLASPDHIDQVYSSFGVTDVGGITNEKNVNLSDLTKKKKKRKTNRIFVVNSRLPKKFVKVPRFPLSMSPVANDHVKELLRGIRRDLVDKVSDFFLIMTLQKKKIKAIVFKDGVNFDGLKQFVCKQLNEHLDKFSKKEINFSSDGWMYNKLLLLNSMDVIVLDFVKAIKMSILKSKQEYLAVVAKQKNLHKAKRRAKEFYMRLFSPIIVDIFSYGNMTKSRYYPLTDRTSFKAVVNNLDFFTDDVVSIKTTSTKHEFDVRTLLSKQPFYSQSIVESFNTGKLTSTYSVFLFNKAKYTVCEPFVDTFQSMDVEHPKFVTFTKLTNESEQKFKYNRESKELFVDGNLVGRFRLHHLKSVHQPKVVVFLKLNDFFF